ncbi:toll/interleukin-1 receptor domain-containing protein [Halomonas pacifica]|uniref:toll/interleukin-1 receptor domain-containing protein n=1 Tax=Bisbaumannia pacifica TaxID=77098 RepID=UPI0023583CD8|nr:toll/interleukin-1 receptor domain-containing protein [Halomonas pacifica]MDC8802779.1 toll/interleukin-1 receptor domain-containing protein [Halomonas pacifica]
MLPPILEIFVVWHPDDERGAAISRAVFDHFMQGPTFSGVIGGGVHVSLRSCGWEGPCSAPRDIYSANHPGPNGIRPANFVAIVPLIGTEMAASVEDTGSEWYSFVSKILEIKKALPKTIGIFPYALDRGASDGTVLGRMLGSFQLIAASASHTQHEDGHGMLCRDLTQGLTQLISPTEMDRLTVFISHTKRHSHDEGEDVDALVAIVRAVIRDTRLEEFFDASDLQPGADWDKELRRKSATSALLAIRTDLYASREWCQREITIAKTNGMPVVMIDAIGVGEQRGSFLMDHVPRVAVRKSDSKWKHMDVYRALNLLVDECLKRELWKHQKELASERPELNVAWWAPHAPEPLTLSYWIDEYLAEPSTNGSDLDIRILHPDPPLGPEEKEFLLKYVGTTRLGRMIDIMTPRQLATRGG